MKPNQTVNQNLSWYFGDFLSFELSLTPRLYSQSVHIKENCFWCINIFQLASYDYCWQQMNLLGALCKCICVPESVVFICPKWFWTSIVIFALFLTGIVQYYTLTDSFWYSDGRPINVQCLWIMLAIFRSAFVELFPAARVSVIDWNGSYPLINDGL